MVTLGPYVAASLLMLHSVGPRVFGDVPLLALIGYGLAVALVASDALRSPHGRSLASWSESKAGKQAGLIQIKDAVPDLGHYAFPWPEWCHKSPCLET